jgi:sterol desaturase/sphingolipid hydroxylase (fatty acid hydroxylase superfamily)
MRSRADIAKRLAELSCGAHQNHPVRCSEPTKMSPETIAIFLIFCAFAAAEAWRHSFVHKPGQQTKDLQVEILGGLALLLVTQPLVMLISIGLAGLIWPQGAGTLVDTSLGLKILLLLLCDDMMQYWWHRLSHRVPWLYKLHRAHHDAPYMSVRIMYRNNVFYYALMPSLWLSGLLIYLGLGAVYAVYLVVKLAVIAGAHSDIRWDEKLRASPVGRPLMWLLTRVISTPLTHFSHHGKHLDDAGTHYKGNYGNLLFIWDLIFGSARIPDRYPSAYGVEHLPDVGAAEQLFWPLVNRTPRLIAEPRSDTPPA